MQVILVVLVSIGVVAALPPKGCASCMLAPVENNRHAGKSTVEKLVGSDGCFIQRMKCAGRTETAETFVQFNYGKSGFFSKGEQTIDLVCNESGDWVIDHASLITVVESLACLST